MTTKYAALTQPPSYGRDECHAVVIKTDYGNEQSWQPVTAEPMKPWGDDNYEPLVHFVRSF
ncbi:MULTISPECIES: hypothetical protein [unclassified Streptomyces]|uniref:hypothetical protein n=1 Tax=unclassified Streptomyces TaxID=2593676 RepID=UPI00342D3B1B